MICVRHKLHYAQGPCCNSPLHQITTQCLFWQVNRWLDSPNCECPIFSHLLFFFLWGPNYITIVDTLIYITERWMSVIFNRTVIFNCYLHLLKILTQYQFNLLSPKVTVSKTVQYVFIYPISKSTVLKLLLKHGF